MMVTKSPYIDPALSILITLFILWQVVKRLKETAFIFLQGVPPQLSISAIEHKILEIEGVKSLHHTHLWSLDGEQNVFTTHVKLDSSIKTAGELTALRERLNQVLKEFTFSHHTIELELDSEVCRFES
jgi:cobalt-zinc-cadmium efflux system protein